MNPAFRGAPGRRVEALLFDIGGVVIDFDWERVFTAWNPISRLSRESMRHTFGFDAEFEAFERGEIPSRTYFSHLASLLHLQADEERIVEGWNDIFIGEVSGTVAMLQGLKQRIPCYAFTNTNVMHHAAWTGRYPRVPALFEHVFTSFEAGCRKPEVQVFDYVSRAMGVSPDAMMFFDDLAENVEAANRAGLQGVHVRSPVDVGQFLRSFA